jgi:hypothetical protein
MSEQEVRKYVLNFASAFIHCWELYWLRALFKEGDYLCVYALSKWDFTDLSYIKGSLTRDQLN